jgi:ribulose-phosphate 3-epimerase
VNRSRAKMPRPPQISASVLNADFARLGDEVRRAEAGGVDSIHLDVMDGHFVKNITMGPVVVEALRPHSALPYHSHLMISQPLRYVRAFAEAGSDVVIFHLEAQDDPAEVIAAIRTTGRGAGLAINPETPAEAAHPYLEQIDLLLVMTVHPGWGGQAFMSEVLPKLAALRAEAEARALDLPISVDGGVKLETIGAAYAAGGDVLVVGKGLYGTDGDLQPVVESLRGAALGGAARGGASQPAGASTPVVG